MSSISTGMILWSAASDPLALALLLSFLLLFALLIAWMITSERKRRERQRERALLLGFQPVDPPNPALTAQILALHTHKTGQQRELRNLFFRRAMEGDIYLFDLWDPSGDSSTLLAGSAVAITSPNLRLPRFTLISRLEENGGGAVRLLTRAANWAITQFGSNMWMVAFVDDPDFTSRFFLAVPNEDDEGAARAFFNPDLRRQLIRLGHLQIEAGGSLFTLSNYEVHSAREAEQPEKIRQQVSQAQLVARLFEDVREKV